MVLSASSSATAAGLSRASQLRQVCQRARHRVALMLESVRLLLGDLDLDRYARAAAGLLEAPLVAQVGDEAGDLHATAVAARLELLRHGEVRIALGVHRVAAVARLDGLHARPP